MQVAAYRQAVCHVEFPGEISKSTGNLKSYANRPYLLEFQWRLLADELSLVPRLVSGDCSAGLHILHARRFRQRTSIVVIAMLFTGCATNPRSLCESLVPSSWTYLPQAPQGSAGLESSLPVTPSDGLKLVMTGFCAMSRCDRDANNFRANRRYHRMFEVRPLFNYTPSYARLAFSRL
jgi:hypothetical protein